MRYKVKFDYSVPNTTIELKKDEIIDPNNSLLSAIQLQSLFGLGVLEYAETSSKVKLQYNNSLNYLQGDSCTNYGSLWVANKDIAKNKIYANAQEWEIDWDIDVRGN